MVNDDNQATDIFVRDRTAGTTRRIRVGLGNSSLDRTLGLPALSDDGRFVVFSGGSTIGDPSQVFINDRDTGQTTRLDVNSNEVASQGGSAAASISADGNLVVFESVANDLVAGDTNQRQDVFLRDRQAGTTTRINIPTTGGQANHDSFRPRISADGKVVVYSSFATNLVPGDTNNIASTDVFVRDLQAGTTSRVSVNSDGVEGDNGGGEAKLDATGRHIVFESGSHNLDPSDTDDWIDIFVHDRLTGATERVNETPAGGQTNHNSESAAISGDGSVVAFASVANNLTPGDTNDDGDIFVVELSSQSADRARICWRRAAAECSARN